MEGQERGGGGDKGAIQRAREQGEASGERGETERREKGLPGRAGKEERTKGESVEERGIQAKLRPESREEGEQRSGERAAAERKREQRGKGKIEERARGRGGEGSRRERERRPGKLRGPAVGRRAKSFLSRFLGWEADLRRDNPAKPPTPRPSERPQLYKYRGWGSRAAAQGSATPEKALLSLAN